MKLLLDSNVLLRWADSRASEHSACAEAVTALAEQSHAVYVCAQVLIESYVVATRPAEANGLGFTLSEGRRFLADIEESFPCLPEPADMGKRWSAVVNSCKIVGKQAHDARIAAIMLARQISHIFTLNPADFARYRGVIPITLDSI